MTVSAEEFIRRFLIHILPLGFIKIRHYGILGNRNRNSKLLMFKKLTNTPQTEFKPAPTLEIIQRIFGKDALKCPVCETVNFAFCGASPP